MIHRDGTKQEEDYSSHSIFREDRYRGEGGGKWGEEKDCKEGTNGIQSRVSLTLSAVSRKVETSTKKGERKK